MLSAIIIFLTFVGQSDSTQRFGPNDQAQREIQEAKRLADMWAFYSSAEEFGPGHPSQYTMKQAAYRQICKAYDVSAKEFNSIIADQRIARLRLIPTQKPPQSDSRPIRMKMHPWLSDKTLFDPSKVTLPKDLAERIHHVNPKPDPQKPKIESDKKDRETTKSIRNPQRRRSELTSPYR